MAFLIHLDINDPTVFSLSSCSDERFLQFIEQDIDLFDFENFEDAVINWAKRHSAIPGITIDSLPIEGSTNRWPALKFSTIDEKLIFLLKL